MRPFESGWRRVLRTGCTRTQRTHARQWRRVTWPSCSCRRCGRNHRCLAGVLCAFDWDPISSPPNEVLILYGAVSGRFGPSFSGAPLWPYRRRGVQALARHGFQPSPRVHGSIHQAVFRVLTGNSRPTPSNSSDLARSEESGFSALRMGVNVGAQDGPCSARTGMDR